MVQTPGPHADPELSDITEQWLEQLRQAVARIPTTKSGTGSPEGEVFGRRGWLYIDTEGGAGSQVWVKTTTSGQTGWVSCG